MALTKASVEIFEQEAILIIHDHEDTVRPIANSSTKGTKTSQALRCKWLLKEIEQEFHGQLEVFATHFYFDFFPQFALLRCSLPFLMWPLLCTLTNIDSHVTGTAFKMENMAAILQSRLTPFQIQPFPPPLPSLAIADLFSVQAASHFPECHINGTIQGIAFGV